VIWTDSLWLASQNVLAPGASEAIRDRVRRWIRAHGGDGRNLDVGCGPRSRLKDAGIEAIGVDLQPGRCITACATHLPFASGVFNSVWSFGLLHHLDDAAAIEALAEMRRVAQAGGHMIVFDGVLPEHSRPLASMLRRLDRGRRFRSQGELEQLLARCGDWRAERFTYSRTGLEGVFAWMPIGCRSAISAQ